MLLRAVQRDEHQPQQPYRGAGQPAAAKGVPGCLHPRHRRNVCRQDGDTDRRPQRGAVLRVEPRQLRHLQQRAAATREAARGGTPHRRHRLHPALQVHALVPLLRAYAPLRRHTLLRCAQGPVGRQLQPEVRHAGGGVRRDTQRAGRGRRGAGGLARCRRDRGRHHLRRRQDEVAPAHQLVPPQGASHALAQVNRGRHRRAAGVCPRGTAAPHGEQRRQRAARLP